MFSSVLFWKGCLLGFSIAAPVGPIGVLCIRRSLARGALIGFVTGLGAATADALYGCIAGFGLTYVAGLLTTYQMALRLIGGIFLAYLGIKIFNSKPASGSGKQEMETTAGAYISTLILTITNPMTILSFAAAFAALGLATENHQTLGAVSLVAGVFTGSAVWWFILSSAASLASRHVNPGNLLWINRASGLVICAFAVLAWGSLLAL